MAEQHTPGPWDIHNDIDIVSPDDGPVAYIAWSRGKPVKANARLIAAAPAMLDALRLASQALVNLQAEGESRYSPIIRQANAAIEAAGG